MDNKDSLGNRIKSYENVSRPHLLRRMPVMIRIDGKAFHTFTRNFKRPFDENLQRAMVAGAYEVICQVQGFKCAYIQSDEVSILITDFDDINTQGWFDYNLSKMVSISASAMTVGFNGELSEIEELKIPKRAMFDSRAFNVPKEDVANAFLWRMKDWQRNSIQMYARAFFSHKELNGKGCSDMHDMLHSIGKNWATDLADKWKNGIWIIATEKGVVERADILPNFESVNAVIQPLLQPKEEE